MHNLTVFIPQLHTITANNASTNSRMTLELQTMIHYFNMKEKLLVCISHVIKLGAKAGLEVLGSIHKEIGTKVSMADSESSQHTMLIASLTTNTNGLGLDMKTIIKRIHGLSTYVCFSPQRHESRVQFCCLNIEVLTRWNSTFQRIQGMINLFPSCDFCSEIQELIKYHLSPAEWSQAANLMHLLEPLSKVTDILCRSKYPTLNKVLPVYLVSMKHHKQVQNGLYNQSLLIQPATLVVQKIKQLLFLNIITYQNKISSMFFKKLQVTSLANYQPFFKNLGLLLQLSHTQAKIQASFAQAKISGGAFMP
ncbi:hypothetical protein VP01_3467g1 [Puccinia sorghi]|uniref:Uncharacterized protein n=1 Tax=Puccinia sorghi TaxID=27349 RepID=A0A0L6UWW2_9BASI|nr:hypothetical protein VP01_3467g1 [Puccinia sorghi]